jgi:FKBP-type peptidyl-prolyl cis-trans isomerase SlyD
VLEPGSIIRLSYDMWLENVEGVFDTTDRDRASESGLYEPKQVYGPIVAIVGAGRLVPGLDIAIRGKGKVGEWVEVELQPEDAFGPRDAKRIETVPMQRFKQSKVAPRVGERVQYKNRPATITRVAGGRVWVDTNSPLAGRTVKYRFRVEEIITDPVERVKAIVEHAYRRGVDFDVKRSGDDVDLVVPDEVRYDQHWPIAKFRIAHELGQHTGVKRVRFIEEYVTQPETPPEGAGADADSAAEAAKSGTETSTDTAAGSDAPAGAAQAATATPRQ